MRLDSGTPAFLTGSYGFLIDASFSDTLNGHGFSLLGVMNFDSAGNASGPYTVQTGASGGQPAQTVTGTFTGTSSLNPDRTGSVTVALDAGITAQFSIVTTDGGSAIQMVLTNCSGGCDISGTLVRGSARLVYTGGLSGSFGFALNNAPMPLGTLGVMSFDGAGNVSMSYNSVSTGGDPNQPPMSSGTLTGTYTQNGDGTGTIAWPAQAGLAAPAAFAIAVTDSGAGIFLLKTNGASDGNVSSGTARLQ